MYTLSATTGTRQFLYSNRKDIRKKQEHYFKGDEGTVHDKRVAYTARAVYLNIVDDTEKIKLTKTS